MFIDAKSNNYEIDDLTSLIEYIEQTTFLPEKGNSLYDVYRYYKKLYSKSNWEQELGREASLMRKYKAYKFLFEIPEQEAHVEYMYRLIWRELNESLLNFVKMQDLDTHTKKLILVTLYNTWKITSMGSLVVTLYGNGYATYNHILNILINYNISEYVIFAYIHGYELTEQDLGLFSDVFDVGNIYKYLVYNEDGVTVNMVLQYIKTVMYYEPFPSTMIRDYISTKYYSYEGIQEDSRVRKELSLNVVQFKLLQKTVVVYLKKKFKELGYTVGN